MEELGLQQTSFAPDFHLGVLTEERHDIRPFD